MTLWKVLHVVSMFSAVTLLVGASIFFDVSVRQRDARLLARFGRVAMGPLANIGIGLIVAGLVFGLATAIVGEFDLTDTWLVIAYVLVVVLFILGPIEGRLAGRAIEAADAAGDGWPDELAKIAEDPRRSTLTVVSTLIYVAIVVDMVAKPG
jgi:uncharacterized membrane protein